MGFLSAPDRRRDGHTGIHRQPANAGDKLLFDVRAAGIGDNEHMGVAGQPEHDEHYNRRFRHRGEHRSSGFAY